jgi:ABC-type Fe3+ transport system substrate-binding protein
LATFGIVYNRDVLRRLGIAREPEQWMDLTDPRLAGQVAMADPTKSGSVAKAFELIIQQQMQQAVTSRQAAGIEASAAEAAGIREGWREGLKLIQRMSANARYFTDSAAKIPLEIARADAAAGMAIESYGKATEDFVRQADGHSRVGFVAPLGGTSLSVDPIALLRGAPEPRLATEFAGSCSHPGGRNSGPSGPEPRRDPSRPRCGACPCGGISIPTPTAPT